MEKTFSHHTTPGPPNTDPNTKPPYEYFDENGHGTHTAGTVLGATIGVAPKAKLWVAKVCGGGGQCSSQAMIKAINWAVEKKVDAVNISIGGGYGGYAEKTAYEAADKAGVLVAAAAGNNGSARVAYPANFPSVIAVGAITESLKRAEFSQYGPGLNIVAPGDNIKSSYPGEGVTIELNFSGVEGIESPVENVVAIGSNPGAATWDVGLVHAGTGKKEEITDDVNGRIALIARGEIYFLEKVKNATEKGAIGVIIYNNEPGLITPHLSDTEVIEIPVVGISQEIGLALKESLSQGEGPKAIMISVVGPAYAALSGTSMASPHVVGVLALMRAVKPDLKTNVAKELLLSSAIALEDEDSKSELNEYGDGLVNAADAIDAALGFVKDPSLTSLPVLSDSSDWPLAIAN